MSARADGQQLGSDYIEVFFESLLDDPEQVLSNICQFLEIKYIETMLCLSVSHEDRGDAKGELRIVANNKRKYSLLGRSVIKRIEEIVFPTAVAFGYELEYATSVRPLSSFRRRLLQIHDGLAMTSFYMKDKGISWGAKCLWQGVLRKGGIQKVSDHMRRKPRVNHYE